jgi:hypothetical protein
MPQCIPPKHDNIKRFSLTIEERYHPTCHGKSQTMKWAKDKVSLYSKFLMTHTWDILFLLTSDIKPPGFQIFRLGPGLILVPRPLNLN